MADIDNVDLDSMTDDEAAAYIDNALASGELDTPEDDDTELEEVEVIEEESVEEEDGDTTEDSTDPEEDDEPEEGEVEEEVTDTPDKVEETQDDEDADEAEEEASEESTEEEEEGSVTQDTLDMRKLREPFKASGTEIQVETVDEAIAFMKKGVHFTKEMQKLKPRLRTIQTLDEHKITDEDISLFIDARKGDPSAIKKLIADAEVEVLDLELEDTSNYVPKDYKVSEAQYDLDRVVEEVTSTETGQETMRIVTNQWDDSSREIVVKHPAILTYINKHVELGYYAKVQGAVDKDKLLGKLEGLNDVDAYKSKWEEMWNAGVFGDPTGADTNPTEAAKPSTTKQLDSTKKQAATKRKKVAAGTKSRSKSSSTPIAPDFDAMSDEEFEEYWDKHK